MYRLLICLPLCLVLAPDRIEVPPSEASPAVGPADTREPLPAPDPVTFLKKCLERYDQQHIQGYSLIMLKQERIGGRLQPREELQVFFRAQPFSVFMHWLRGERRAASVLYVVGENDDKMLVHPAGVAGTFVKVVTRDPEGEEARQAGRYSIKQFGLRKTLERTLHDWQAAQEAGTLHVAYLGVRKVHEIGDRPCYTLRRTIAKPVNDGLAQVTIYLDTGTWFQVGSVLKAEDDKLLGEYLYRDIQLNPPFKPNQFERSALTE